MLKYIYFFFFFLFFFKFFFLNDKSNKDEKKPEDTAGEVQKQMAMITPVMFGYFAFQFPLGLALYWNVFGLFGIMQQLQVNRQK